MGPEGEEREEVVQPLFLPGEVAPPPIQPGEQVVKDNKGASVVAHVLPGKNVLDQRPADLPVALHDNVVSFDNSGNPIPKGNPAKLYKNIPGVNVPKNFNGFIKDFSEADRNLYRAIYKEDKKRTHRTTMEEYWKRKQYLQK